MALLPPLDPSPSRVGFCKQPPQIIIAAVACSPQLAFNIFRCGIESLQGADDTEKAAGAKEPHTKKRLPMLLLGGCSLGDTGSHLMAQRCPSVHCRSLCARLRLLPAISTHLHGFK